MAQMSPLERWMVNSPFRAWLQRGEISSFMRWASLDSASSVLDMGCGRGISTSLILKRVTPLYLAAFDFDSDMVDSARRRLARRGADGGVDLRVADATKMPYESGRFDAAFESGVVHHVPDWQAALREVARVLKPGGRFCFAEPSRGRLRGGLYRILPHAVESMFDEDEWCTALHDAGLAFDGPISRMPLWDICGVAVRTRGEAAQHAG